MPVWVIWAALWSIALGQSQLLSANGFPCSHSYTKTEAMKPRGGLHTILSNNYTLFTATEDQPASDFRCRAEDVVDSALGSLQQFIQNNLGSNDSVLMPALVIRTSIWNGGLCYYDLISKVAASRGFVALFIAHQQWDTAGRAALAKNFWKKKDSLETRCFVLDSNLKNTSEFQTIALNSVQNPHDSVTRRILYATGSVFLALVSLSKLFLAIKKFISNAVWKSSFQWRATGSWILILESISSLWNFFFYFDPFGMAGLTPYWFSQKFVLVMSFYLFSFSLCIIMLSNLKAHCALRNPIYFKVRSIPIYVSFTLLTIAFILYLIVPGETMIFTALWYFISGAFSSIIGSAYVLYKSSILKKMRTTSAMTDPWRKETLILISKLLYRTAVFIVFYGITCFFAGIGFVWGFWDIVYIGTLGALFSAQLGGWCMVSGVLDIAKQEKSASQAMKKLTGKSKSKSKSREPSAIVAKLKYDEDYIPGGNDLIPGGNDLVKDDEEQ